MRARKRRPGFPNRETSGKEPNSSLPHFPETGGTAKTRAPSRTGSGKGHARRRMLKVGMPGIFGARAKKTGERIGKEGGTVAGEAEKSRFMGGRAHEGFREENLYFKSCHFKYEWKNKHNKNCP